MSASPVLGHRQQKKLDTWRALREAAIRLMLEQSFDEVSVDEIAAAAKVSRATFFNYFRSKEAVILDPDPAMTAEAIEILAARPADEPVWESLTESVIDFTRRNSDRLTVKYRITASSPALAQSRRDAGQPFWDEIRRWLADRVPDGPHARFQVDLITNIALAVADTATTAWNPDDGPDALAELLRIGFDTAEVSGFR
ncbi:TetR/AcrR family transcriptional regulator [Nocardia terpenica]|uniref:TetR family transcriptional regulator n=1 Tax=Nocardia terpenica TaxID=455432 RepID=A0A6G9Z6X5_9NOCA|nr:TetR/AcrR family transcriptional regulator [Nocardia terpenica]QIS21365.1 TetR family transcriptional regulator [Nocardia terpenica]